MVNFYIDEKQVTLEELPLRVDLWDSGLDIKDCPL